MGIKICPKCNGLMIKQLGIYGFYYFCKHCDYEIIDKEIENIEGVENEKN